MSVATEHERFAEVVSRGFDAGNYGNVYETNDYDAARDAIDVRQLPEVLHDAYLAAFTLGFFGSYTLPEMGEHVEAYREAYFSEGGKQCLEAGYTEARDDEWKERDE